jgi:hypothetical protein
VLPCGLPADADAFVRSSTPPKPLADSAAAAAAASAAVASASRPAPRPAVAAAASGEEMRQKGVYAKPGSAIAASQAKMGENSYYYSVGKNRAAGSSSTVTPAVAVVKKDATVQEVTISTYSMLDDDANVKVHIPLAGASSLGAGAIECLFRPRAFDLRVLHEGKRLRLHVPILLELVDPAKCAVKKKAGKLILVLAKAEPDKGWYELRKTKGVGDTEYHKIVPDEGEPTTFTL